MEKSSLCADGMSISDAGGFTLEETKNDEPRTVPLTGIAHSLLRKYLRVPRIDTDLLFPGTNPANPVDLRKSWDNALRKAHISDFRFHDLRHTAASYFALSGASIKDIATILGHKSLAMANRYTHISESHTEQVVHDLAHATTFLDLLEPGGLFTFQTFSDCPAAGVYPGVLHGTLSEHAAELTRLNQGGAGVFVMVNAGDGVAKAAAKTCDYRHMPTDGSWPR